jgi:hypothetical protein
MVAGGGIREPRGKGTSAVGRRYHATALKTEKALCVL